jgi:hypothetical protein
MSGTGWCGCGAGAAAHARVKEERLMAGQRIGCVAGLVGLVLGLAAAGPAQGAERYWVTPGSGSFGATANWAVVPGGTPGQSVPGSADVANFTLNAAYGVTLSAPVTNQLMEVENGSVTLAAPPRGFLPCDQWHPRRQHRRPNRQAHDKRPRGRRPDDRGCRRGNRLCDAGLWKRTRRCCDRRGRGHGNAHHRRDCLQAY